MTEPRSIAALLAAAEPEAPRPLGELVARLESAGRLRTVRAGDPRTATGALPVRGLAYDSRRVQPGFLFVAVPGAHADGHDYVDVASSRGAIAAIVERPLSLPIPQLIVDRSQLALANAATWWYGEPSLGLGIVGVTGTDGKTTTSFLALAALEAAGISTGLLTTAELKIGDVRDANPEHVTTPEAPQLQSALRAMARAGNAAAVVETTSHGLALERVGGIAYDVALFTNLTHEHLEFHGTFEAYRDAKLSLFRRLAVTPANPRKVVAGVPWPKAAVINLDDPASAHFIAAARAAGADVVTYGTDDEAQIRAVRVEEDATRLTLEVVTRRWQAPLHLRLAGRFNVHNALAAVALGEVLDLDPERVRQGIADVPGVPGRMERVVCGQPFGVIVDYAHSPASLQKVLDLLAPLAAARGGGLIAVFGSAGERDTAKRPMMGRIAAERCRVVVVTNEDPRGEDPEAILEEIASGAEEAGGRRGQDLLTIADRRAAIEAAFERARPGDMVLLAGKGHERSIIMGRSAEPWNEREEAVRALELLGYRQG